MNKRLKAERFGRIAESCAALLLCVKGYRILKRRFKCPMGEIDIIAQKGSFHVFVVVTARQSKRLALESITHRQRQRIERAALLWSAKQSHTGPMRFDVIIVGRNFFPQHIKQAWPDTWL